MKVLILEHDIALAQRIKEYLCSTRIRFDVKIISKEEDLSKDLAFLKACSIFVLNLKNPKDIKIKNFIRENISEAPILLILEKNINPSIFKELYYLSYDDVITKDFFPEEITFRIYKLCKIWNDDIFFISNEIYFNYKVRKFYYKEKEILLGKKESRLLKLLFMKAPSIVSFEDINYYVYIDNMISQEKVRSLVKEVRKKIIIDLIKTKKGEGYSICKDIKSFHKK